MGFQEISYDIAHKIKPEIEVSVERKKTPVWDAVEDAFVGLAAKLRDDPELRVNVEESAHISEWLVEQMERYPVSVDVIEKTEQAKGRRLKKNKTTQQDEEFEDAIAIQKVKSETTEVKKARRLSRVRSYFLGDSGSQDGEKKPGGIKKKIILREEPNQIFIDYKVIAPLAIMNLKRGPGQEGRPGEYPLGSSVTQTLAWAEINEDGLVYLKRNTFYPKNPDGSPQTKDDGTRVSWGTEIVEIFDDPDKFTQEEVLKSLSGLLGLLPVEQPEKVV